MDDTWIPTSSWKVSNHESPSPYLLFQYISLSVRKWFFLCSFKEIFNNCKATESCQPSVHVFHLDSHAYFFTQEFVHISAIVLPYSPIKTHTFNLFQRFTDKFLTMMSFTFLFQLELAIARVLGWTLLQFIVSTWGTVYHLRSPRMIRSWVSMSL